MMKIIAATIEEFDIIKKQIDTLPKEVQLDIETVEKVFSTLTIKLKKKFDSIQKVNLPMGERADLYITDLSFTYNFKLGKIEGSKEPGNAFKFEFF